MPHRLATCESDLTSPILTVVSCAGAGPATAVSASAISAAWVRVAVMGVLPESLSRLDQIAPVAITVERDLCAQRLELAHDLAAVAAAHRAHQLLEEFRPIGERSLDRREALAVKSRRLRHLHLQASGGANRPGQVEARFGAHS